MRCIGRQEGDPAGALVHAAAREHTERAVALVSQAHEGWICSRFVATRVLY